MQMLQRHPRRVLALLGSVLLGTGATAFAVATFVPDPSSVPVRQIVESVEPAARPEGAQTLTGAPIAPFVLYRSDSTRSNDTADSLLRRLGILDAGAAQFIKSDATARQVLLSRPGRSVTAEVDANNALIQLTARWTPDDSANFQRLLIQRSNGQITSRLETAPLTANTRLASGTIKSSLFAATDESRIPDAVAVQLAEIFSGDIDFIRALRKGDRFSVVYESLEADGEPLRAGRVLSADFVNAGKTYSAVWFHEPGAAKGQYFTLEGNSMRKAFLASPLEFSRMTSGFGGRMHPIARQFRMHNGVDYAAPTGTPIRSVGDGVVDFAGVQRGYGNVVEIKHRDGKSTLYAHMHSIAVRKGQAVAQGQNIGTVGSTGWSTGPHLHFEFRVNGVHHDPMTLAKQSESVQLSAASRPAFNSLAQDVRLKLAAAASLQLASAQ
ncbi:M23 family metallopeptidase [Variovorax sp. PCZ-1]|nr:M23 family metallopeptidase [Variovorax sp. PCZ-1]MBS7808251.1 M23 family metallopeptidase [Variovorax sp. PCZ-1]